LKDDKISKNVWIIKPGESTNRGNGIVVMNSLDQIASFIKEKEKNHTYLIQS
jgi:hypothetical protein